ncbi:unnamed protein product [Cylindrotheca closterium]|uniref:Uncharacterized protein n=1 Tax=Cylindrotheca closterium TaxID=2856 RepID=A0AAD2G5I1_9STRA|nr:unnamed protein product [Cylindrotheca closterium]
MAERPTDVAWDAAHTSDLKRLATANSESGRETATHVRTRGAPAEEEEIDSSDGRHGPLFNNNAKNDVANMMMNRDLQWPDLALQVTENMMENMAENEDPKNFQEAWNHPEDYQEKWGVPSKTDGCMQILDFTEHFAPVINDITWRIILVAMMIWKLVEYH